MWCIWPRSTVTLQYITSCSQTWLSLYVCVLWWLLKWQANDQAGRVCVLSGFLSRRLADQKERRVWRVCSQWGFVVCSCATNLIALYYNIIVVVLWGEKRNFCCRACTWEALSDCSLSMWLGFRCLPASVNSKKSHQCFRAAGRQLNFTHESTLCNSESTSDMVRGSTVSGLGNPHLTTSVSTYML